MTNAEQNLAHDSLAKPAGKTTRFVFTMLLRISFSYNNRIFKHERAW